MMMYKYSSKRIDELLMSIIVGYEKSLGVKLDVHYNEFILPNNLYRSLSINTVSELIQYKIIPEDYVGETSPIIGKIMFGSKIISVALESYISDINYQRAFKLHLIEDRY